MKNLIIYSTMYGCTEKCSNLLKEKLNGETLVINAGSKNIPEPKDFDNIILGSSIKVGKIGKALSKYVNKYEDVLIQKKIALFVCGGDNENDYIRQNFSKSIYDNSVSKEFFGGEISMEKVGFITGLILKMVGKYESYSKIEMDKIEILAEKINN